jgi:hypothetical protein
MGKIIMCIMIQAGIFMQQLRGVPRTWIMEPTCMGPGQCLDCSVEAVAGPMEWLRREGQRQQQQRDKTAAAAASVAAAAVHQQQRH